MYLEVIAVLHYKIILASSMHVSCTLVFHQSKCITPCGVSSLLSPRIYARISFMYLCAPCYCDACLKSSALRVWMKTLHNALYQGWPTRRSWSTVRSPSL